MGQKKTEITIPTEEETSGDGGPLKLTLIERCKGGSGVRKTNPGGGVGVGSFQPSGPFFERKTLWLGETKLLNIGEGHKAGTVFVVNQKKKHHQKIRPLGAQNRNIGLKEKQH